MTDVTIPADTARQIAGILREQATLPPKWSEWHKLADLLDPPAPSLRDELVEEIEESLSPDDIAPVVLAVVRRHVEALPTFGSPDGWPEPLGLNRDDVLRLLGGDQ